MTTDPIFPLISMSSALIVWFSNLYGFVFNLKHKKSIAARFHFAFNFNSRSAL